MQLKNYLAVFDTWKQYVERIHRNVTLVSDGYSASPMSVTGLDFASETITTSGPIDLQDLVHGSRGVVVNYSGTMSTDTHNSKTFTGTMSSWDF